MGEPGSVLKSMTALRTSGTRSLLDPCLPIDQLTPETHMMAHDAEDRFEPVIASRDRLGCSVAKRPAQQKILERKRHSELFFDDFESFVDGRRSLGKCEEPRRAIEHRERSAIVVKTSLWCRSADVETQAVRPA